LSWDAVNEAFVSGFTGRLTRIDRFRTLYHRPTRRQKLTFSKDVSLPSSYVVKRDADDEVFVVSETLEREFWRNDDNYDNVVTLHRVVGPSGGVVEHHAARTSGAGDDLGAVTVANVGPGFADFELRTTQREDVTEDVELGNYLVTYSKGIAAQVGDYLKFGDDYYRLSHLYFDSGFYAARAYREAPAYVTAEYQFRNPPQISYDPTTGAVTEPAPATRQVSLLVSKRTTRADAGGDKPDLELEAFVYTHHIGFVPQLLDKLTIDSTVYRVLEVEYSQLQLQWRLRLGV
jgi:hypothetical protein